MSTTYPELLNNFPDELDNFDRFQDPAIEDLTLINNYYTAFNAGDLAGAAAILTTNPTLQTKIINAENLNKIRDAIISMQKFYLDDISNILEDLVSYKDVYSPTAQYEKYDVIGYTIDLHLQYFMCINNSVPIGTLPTNTTYFVPLTLKGEQGVSGTGLSYRGEWSSATQYYKDDCVSDNNKLWAANANNLNSKPALDNSDWVLVVDIYKQVILSVEQPVGQAVGDVWYSII